MKLELKILEADENASKNVSRIVLHNIKTGN